MTYISQIHGSCLKNRDTEIPPYKLETTVSYNTTHDANTHCLIYNIICIYTFRTYTACRYRSSTSRYNISQRPTPKESESIFRCRREIAKLGPENLQKKNIEMTDVFSRTTSMNYISLQFKACFGVCILSSFKKFEKCFEKKTTCAALGN